MSAPSRALSFVCHTGRAVCLVAFSLSLPTVAADSLSSVVSYSVCPIVPIRPFAFVPFVQVMQEVAGRPLTHADVFSTQRACAVPHATESFALFASFASSVVVHRFECGSRCSVVSCVCFGFVQSFARRISIRRCRMQTTAINETRHQTICA